MFGARKWNLKPNFNRTVGYARKTPYIHSLDSVGDFGVTPAFGIVESVKGLTRTQGFDEFTNNSLSNLTNKHFWTQKIKEGVDKHKKVAGLDEFFDKKFYNKKFKKAFCCNVDDKGLNELAMAFCKALCENISKAFEDRSVDYGGKETERKVDYLLAKKLADQSKETYTLNPESVGDFKPYKQLYGVGDYANVPSTQQYAAIARKDMLENQAYEQMQQQTQKEIAQQRVVNQITPDMALNSRLANQGMLVELNDLQNDIVNYKNQITTLQSQLNGASNQILSQQKIMDENVSLKQSLSQLQNQLQQVQQQLQQVSQTNSQLQSQISSQQNELGNIERLKSSNMDLSTQLNQCKNNNIELNNQISQLQVTLRDLKDQLQSKSGDENIIRDLHSTVDQLQVTIASLKSENQNKDSIIGQYKEAVQKLQSALQEAQSKASSGGGGGFLGGIGNVVGDVLGTVTKPITGLLGGIGKIFGVGSFCLPGAQDWEIFLHKIIVDGEQVNKEKFIKILDDKIKNVKKVEVKQKINGVTKELTEEEKELEEILIKNSLPIYVEEKLEQELIKELKEEEALQPAIEQQQQESETFLGKKRGPPVPLLDFNKEVNDYPNELKEKLVICLKKLEEGMETILNVPPNDVKTKSTYLKDIGVYCFEAVKFTKGSSDIAHDLAPEYKPLASEISLLLGELLRQVNLLADAYLEDEDSYKKMLPEAVDIVGKRLEKLILNYFTI